MRVLVTNDDGISSPGLVALSAELSRRGHAVCVIAPERDVSGCGSAHQIPADGLMSWTEHPADGAVARVSVPATTAICVTLAAAALFAERPNVVVCGVNAGLNVGRSILQSGNVAAAVGAAGGGFSALAVSLDGKDDFAAAVQIAAEAVEMLETARRRTVLNINVPSGNLSQMRGIREGRIAAFTRETQRWSVAGPGRLQAERAASALALDPLTDAGVVADGYVSVTALTGFAAASGEGLASALHARLNAIQG
jgi:5'-nucleotidase